MIDLPLSPTDGQEVTFDDRTWVWRASVPGWDMKPVSSSDANVAAAAAALAREWATKTVGEVIAGQGRGAKYYADLAQAALGSFYAASVYVDAYGGDIEAAVNALPEEGGVVIFSAKTYVSPYQGTQFGTPKIMTKKYVSFRGAGMPGFNSTFSKLVGGTIIKGSFFFAADGVKFDDLGLDSGKDYCDASNGGVPMEGLVGLDRANANIPGFEGGDPSKFGFDGNNLAILANGTGANGNVSNVHAFLLENYICWRATNIVQVMGGAGMVVKSSHGSMDKVYSRGSFKYGVLNKSEAYSDASFNTYSNIVIEGLANKDPVPNVLTDYDSGGFLIEAVGVPAEHITVTGLVCNGTINGVQFFSDLTFPVRFCTVDNFTVRKAYGYGVLFGNGYMDNVKVSNGLIDTGRRGIYVASATATNCTVSDCLVDGMELYNYSNAGGTGMRIVSCVSRNAGTAHFGNSGGTTEFVGGFSCDTLKPQVGGSGGTVTGLSGVDLGSLGFGTTGTGQPITYTGPKTGSMAAGDYTVIAMRVRNSTGGGVASGEGVGVEFRAYQPGTATNQAGLEIWTRLTSGAMVKAAKFNENGALVQRYSDTAASLDENRTMSFYWGSNQSIGVNFRGSDGVTRTGAIAAELSYSGAFDWPSLAAGAQQSTTVGLTGAAFGDFVEVSMALPLLGTRLWAEVTATNVVTVYQRNDTGAPIDLASGTLRVRVRKPSA